MKIASRAELPPSKPAQEEVLEVFVGVLEGFFSKTDYPDFNACAADATSAFHDIEEAVKDFTKKTKSDVEKALREIGSALGSISGAVEPCKGTGKEIQSLIQTFEAFKSPKEFIFHVGKARGRGFE